MMQYRETKLNLNGFNYYYRVYPNTIEKSRYPIVFVGGAFQDMDSWNNWVKFFAPLTTVILVDLPGGGKADFLPYHYGMDFIADALHGVMVDAGVTKAEIMSVSYGSLTAYVFASKYPEMVSKLYLSGIMKRMPRHVKIGVAKSMAAIKAGDMATFSEMALYGLLYHDRPVTVAREPLIRRILGAALKRMDREAIHKYFDNTKRILLQRELDLTAAPDIPTLVFTGEHDGFTRPEYGREIAAAFRNAIFTTIQNADHLCGTERFEVAAELARRFMDGHSVEGIPGCNAIEYFGSKRNGLDRLAANPA